MCHHKVVISKVQLSVQKRPSSQHEWKPKMAAAGVPITALDDLEQSGAWYSHFFFHAPFSRSFFFPTCQVRVVRFYVCGPSFLRSFFFLFLLAVLFARCRQMSTWTSRVQWAMPDLNREFQIAVGSADLNRGAPKRTGQRRTSTGELQSGLGNAGPQPGSSTADWATPDLNQGAPERSGQRRTSAARRYVRRCVRNMSEKNVRRNVRRNVR